ncbi:MAG TPA: hypothetical protein VMW80_09475, partial [Candidatus Dormibacteraeota bacterium]|nr:hypothetical protein [Candidatus Dormibacteraeota bacterium]
QLKNLAKLADSSNAKLVVPADFAGLMGAAKALVMATESESGPGVAPAANGKTAPEAVAPPSPARALPSGGRRTRNR